MSLPPGPDSWPNAAVLKCVPNAPDLEIDATDPEQRRIAASKPVLVVVLREADPAAHLAWLTAHREYELPVEDALERNYATKIAVYSPKGLAATGELGAVQHYADVESIKRDQYALHYKLGPLTPLTRTLVHPSRTPIEKPFWSSQLALGRARLVYELMLETEPEWQLVDALRAHGIDVDFMRGTPGESREHNPHGRPWIVVGDRMLRYGEASGFIIFHADGDQRAFLRFEQAFEYLARGQWLVR